MQTQTFYTIVYSTSIFIAAFLHVIEFYCEPKKNKKCTRIIIYIHLHVYLFMLEISILVPFAVNK